MGPTLARSTAVEPAIPIRGTRHDDAHFRPNGWNARYRAPRNRRCARLVRSGWCVWYWRLPSSRSHWSRRRAEAPVPQAPTASANALISQGLSAESHGESQKALTDFKEAADKNPGSAIAYYDLGVVYQQSLNDANEATNEYNKAILADPSYKPALFNLATLETSSDPQAAIGVYNQLLKLNPNDVNVLFNLGLLLIAQNQGTQGHIDLKKAISLDPSLASRVPKGITP